MQGKKEAQMHKNNKMLRINEEKGEKNIGRMKKKRKNKGNTPEQVLENGESLPLSTPYP